MSGVDGDQVGSGTLGAERVEFRAREDAPCDPRSSARGRPKRLPDVAPLYPPALDDFGAVAAIESMAEEHRAASGIRVRIECPDPGLRLPSAIELLIFRAFQEGMLNIVKHAQAAAVYVRLALEERAAVLEILDDGVGFDAQTWVRAPSRASGLGLIGMRERVAHFGGALRVTSRPRHGTRILLRVPIDAGGAGLSASVAGQKKGSA